MNMAKPMLTNCKSGKPDCFANKNGICIALSDTEFISPDGKKRACPFYKKKEEKEYDI